MKVWFYIFSCMYVAIYYFQYSPICTLKVKNQGNIGLTKNNVKYIEKKHRVKKKEQKMVRITRKLEILKNYQIVGVRKCHNSARESYYIWLKSIIFIEVTRGAS